ncbi:hypothetical protein MKX01_040194 [Papaver californicum]|nr:hypothetical protein MKX01_040194 [Papaver californicum]
MVKDGGSCYVGRLLAKVLDRDVSSAKLLVWKVIIPSEFILLFFLSEFESISFSFILWNMGRGTGCVWIYIELIGSISSIVCGSMLIDFGLVPMGSSSGGIGMARVFEKLLQRESLRNYVDANKQNDLSQVLSKRVVCVIWVLSFSILSNYIQDKIVFLFLYLQGLDYRCRVFDRGRVLELIKRCSYYIRNSGDNIWCLGWREPLVRVVGIMEILVLFKGVESISQELLEEISKKVVGVCT